MAYYANMNLNRHALSDNVRNTLLDPVIAAAPDSRLTYQCEHCGLTLNNYQSKLIHQRNYCMKRAEGEPSCTDTEKEIMRIRSIEYLDIRPPLQPILPVDPRDRPGMGYTKFIRPYNIERAGYERMPGARHRFYPMDNRYWNLFDSDTYSSDDFREVYSPTWDPIRPIKFESNRAYFNRFKGVSMNGIPKVSQAGPSSNLPPPSSFTVVNDQAKYNMPGIEKNYGNNNNNNKNATVKRTQTLRN